MKEARGGEGIFTLLLSCWLRQQGHDVSVVYRRTFSAVVEEDFAGRRGTTRQGIPAVIPYWAFMIGMFFFSLLSVMKIASLNKKRAISLIHSQDTGYGGLAAVIAAKMLGAPAIVSSHGIRQITLANFLRGPLRPLELPVEEAIDAFVCRRANVIVALSKHVESYIKKHYIPMGKQTRTFVVPTGIRVQSFCDNSEHDRKSTRREFHFADKDLVIGFVGRFSPEKNLVLLVEAFVHTAKAVQDARLLMVGIGPMKQYLENLVRKLGVDDKAIFTGQRSDVNKIMAAIDVFVLPSFTEGCPTALLEAMASGKAAVASDIPSIREIVKHNEDALLINPHSVDELTDALLKLYHNSELRVKLGRKAKQKAKFYDLNQTGFQIMEIYRNTFKKTSHKISLESAIIQK